MAVHNNPLDFASGMKKGTKSLVSHTVGGVSNTVSKMTGSLSTAVGFLAADEEYMREKKNRKFSKRPKDVLEGFAQGFEGMLNSTGGALKGVVKHP